MNPDSLAARLRQTFLDELQEQLVVLNGELLALEGEGAAEANGERLARIFRVAHTLKGAARVAGVPLAETVCHRVESVLADVRAERRTLDADVFALLFATVDALADAGDRLRDGRSLDDSPLAALAGAPELGWSPAAREQPPAAAASPADARRQADAQPPAGTVERRTRDAGAESRAGAPASGTMRVDATRLDQLLAASGQLAVTVMRATDRAEPLSALAEEAERLAARWRREVPALHQLMPDGAAGDGQRQLLERVTVVLRQVALSLRARSIEVRGDARALQRASAMVAEQVRGLRMRPFSDATEALPRLVRDLAAGTGKEAEIVVNGGDVEADRAVLDGVREALLHLVRNAVDHGLESPDERERAGKPRQGTVRIAAALRGGQLRVTVSDDGRGLDVAGLRAQIRRAGAEPPVDERELVRLLFAGGLSTRHEATAISGRGVGLDAVRAAIERVRGTVDVRWTRGAGTVFHLFTPLTLATQRAVLARVSGQPVALPSLAVARLLRLRDDQLRTADGRRHLPTSDGPVPIVSLARILGPPLVEPPATDRLSVALLEVGERRLGVVMDEFLEEAEIVVRGIEHRGAGELPHLAGASLLPDGRIALVLNPAAVVHSGLGGRLAQVEAAPLAEEEHGPPRILVVDDSITTRTLERSVLEAAGYQVTTAVDGEDAWRLLEDEGTDLVITDVEMPRLDGFALCERIRASRRWAQLPVVVVTSLEAPEQRARGLEAGADAYVVKSGFDQEALLQTVRDLLARDDA